MMLYYARYLKDVIHDDLEAYEVFNKATQELYNLKHINAAN